MIDDLAHTLQMSPFSVVAMSLMCLICAFMVGQLMDGILGRILGWVGIFGAGFAGNVVFRKLEFHPLGSKELDAILATTAGLVGGIVLYTVLKLTLTAIYGTSRHIPKTDESAVRSVSSF